MKRITTSMIVGAICFASLSPLFWGPVSHGNERDAILGLAPNLQAKESGGPPVSAQNKPSDQGHSKPCANTTLRDTHGYSFNGTVLAFGEIAATGTVSFDGAGNLSGTYAESVNGTIIQGQFVGSYTVNSDCTGSGGLMGPLPGSWSALVNFVIVNNGKETLLVGASPGTVVIGYTKRL